MLAGKVALITGAARGQGAAEARLFASEGARVAIADVLDDVGLELAAGIPDSRYFHLDVRQEDDWRATLQEIHDEWGRLDVLVNNAGVLHVASISSTALEDYRRVIEVNQIGVFLGMKSVAAPMMESGGGSIINISSTDGLVGENGLLAYVASKFAVRGMTKVAALEFGQFGIRVNSIHPGPVNTQMVWPKDPTIDVNSYFSAQPIPRVAEPEEIAEMAVFLASDRASYCTGAEFVVDGGMTAGNLVERNPAG